MCEKVTSHLFRVTTREMLIHTIHSHSETRTVLGISDKDPNVIEVEWHEGKSQPDIRWSNQDADEQALVTDWYAKKFPDRLAMIKYCIERSKGSLDLSSLKSLPENMTWPQTISGYLDLSGLTSLPENMTWPQTISGSLDLRSLKSLPENMTWPQTIKRWPLPEKPHEPTGEHDMASDHQR